jgi:23S rRNA pseudouridine2605 synthase
VALHEGKNREVRKVLRALGLTANRLIRVAYGPVQLGNLGRGEVAEVSAKVMREQLGKEFGG